MICLLSTFSVYTLTPLTLRGCTTNTHSHDKTRRRRRKHVPVGRVALSTSSTLLLTQRGNYLRNERICPRRGRACFVARSHPPAPPHQLSHLPPALQFVCLFVCFLSAVGCNDTPPLRGSRAALTFSPMSILLKQKVLRWELLSFIAGSTVSRSAFSTNWQM